MQRFHVVGEFDRQAVLSQWVADTRPRIPQIEKAIESAWEIASRRPGIKLFDGPMCRLESFEAGERLTLRLSRTSYKIFWAPISRTRNSPTVLGRRRWPIRWGSAALETADGMLLLGRRDARVAYYPSRIHPFAGALEPRQPLDVFQEMRRELREELSLGEGTIADLICLGIAEDASLRQPELIFHAKSHLDAETIKKRLDAGEHTAVLAIAPEASAVETALAHPAMTPIARATMLLWGRQRWRATWFRVAQGVSSPA